VVRISDLEFRDYTSGLGCLSSGRTGNCMVFNNKGVSTSLARSNSKSLPMDVSANIGTAVPACKTAFSAASSRMCGDAQAVIRSAISQNASASSLEMPVRCTPNITACLLIALQC